VGWRGEKEGKENKKKGGGISEDETHGWGEDQSIHFASTWNELLDVWRSQTQPTG
jgi:hypothetical protein